MSPRDVSDIANHLAVISINLNHYAEELRKLPRFARFVVRGGGTAVACADSSAVGSAVAKLLEDGTHPGNIAIEEARR